MRDESPWTRFSQRVSHAGSMVLQRFSNAGKRGLTRLRGTPWLTLARRYLPLLVGFGVLLLLFALWKLPQWYAASWDTLTDPKDIAKLESDTRATLVQIVGGLFVLVGLFFTAKTWRTTQEGQITDRFTKAINQLGETGPEKLPIRLGGIYALERIARDSERDHWPIIEVLTAYVREHAPWKEEEQRSQEEISPRETQPTQKNQSPPTLATDIQAILTVLGRRARTYENGEDQRLDLHSTDLRGARLDGVHLEGALLLDAQLQGADLRGAQLEGARDLTVEQLATVKALYWADLDAPLREQIEQRYPHLLKEPEG